MSVCLGIKWFWVRDNIPPSKTCLLLSSFEECVSWFCYVYFLTMLCLVCLSALLNIDSDLWEHSKSKCCSRFSSRSTIAACLAFSKVGLTHNEFFSSEPVILYVKAVNGTIMSFFLIYICKFSLKFFCIVAQIISALSQLGIYHILKWHLLIRMGSKDSPLS